MKKNSWSYSSLKDFEGCGFRYHQVKVAKKYPFVETEAIRYGNVAHKACEEYIRDGKELPEGLGKFKEILDKLNRMEGDKVCEKEMALRADLTPTEWFAKDVWVRGKGDLVILKDGEAKVVDYKFGKNKYPDKDQLELMALMVFQYYPHVEEVKGGLLFMEYNDFVKAKYERRQKDKLWEKWVNKTNALDTAFATGRWKKNPTPLCGWCPVEDCEFHKVK